MFPSLEEEIEFLVKLGLTVSEARVYLTLTQIGKAQTGAISKATGIQRTHLYPTLRSLARKCLVEREIDSPTKFKATAPQEALNILMKNKLSQVFELEAKMKTIAENLERKQAQNRTNEKDQTEDTQFTVVPGKQVIINRLRQELQKAKSSIDIITTKKRFASAIATFANDYKEALKRGAKIRIATEAHITEKSVLRTANALIKNPAFKVKYLPPPLEALVTIIDQKEALVMISAAAELTDASALWSNNYCFMAIIQEYFENKWNSALLRENVKTKEEQKQTTTELKAFLHRLENRTLNQKNQSFLEQRQR